MMGKKKLKVTLCRTCYRDNPEEGPFKNFDHAFQEYKGRLARGWLNKTAKVEFQNCFAQCENFFCLQVTQDGAGFLLKKISTPEKVETVLRWVEESKEKGQLQLPACLKEHLVGPVEISKENGAKA